MSTNDCPSCGAPIVLDATECRYCGEQLSVSQPPYQASQDQPYYPPQAPSVHYSSKVFVGQPPYQSKNRAVAGLLAIVLGSLGAHKFYLGKIGVGFLYLLFCWTYIPFILGIIEGISYLVSSEEKFYNQYVNRS